jgi:hypothetical protein
MVVMAITSFHNPSSRQWREVSKCLFTLNPINIEHDKIRGFARSDANVGIGHFRPALFDPL